MEILIIFTEARTRDLPSVVIRLISGEKRPDVSSLFQLANAAFTFLHSNLYPTTIRRYI